jgi:hypothetical protein
VPVLPEELLLEAEELPPDEDESLLDEDELLVVVLVALEELLLDAVELDAVPLDELEDELVELVVLEDVVSVDVEPLLPDELVVEVELAELAPGPALHTWVRGSQTTQVPSAQASPWAQSVVTLQGPRPCCGGVLLQPPSSSGYSPTQGLDSGPPSECR